jgi:hypothetical protein
LVAAVLCAGADDDGGARRTYRLAEELLSGGRVEQAYEAFRQVADGYPASDLADDALLAIARRTFDPASPEALSRADVEGAGVASEALLQLLRRHPSADRAAEAGYLLGLARMVPGSPDYDLDEAFAAFHRVITVHPGSAFVGAARRGCALAELGMGRPESALLHLERLLLEQPSGPLADRARLDAAAAWAWLGDAWQAVHALEEVRGGGAEPGAGEEALDALTRLRRFDLAGLARPAPFALDASYPPSVVDVGVASDIAVDGGGALHVLSDDGRVSLRIDPQGTNVDLRPVQEATGLFRAPGGAIGWAAADGARVAGGAIRFRAAEERLAPLVAVAAMPDGSWVAVDERGRGALRFAPDGTFRSALPVAGRAVDVAVDRWGRIWVLDAKERVVRAFTTGGAAGTTIRAAVDGPQIQAPTGLAVDEGSHVLVLDPKANAVFAFAADGAPLGVLPLGGSVRDARALAVDRSGALLIVDGKARRVRRFQ